MSGDVSRMDQSSTALVPVARNKPDSLPLTDKVTSRDQEPELSLEFQGFMPPHSKEVKAGITASIVQEGYRDKICVWHDHEHNCLVVLDGITRLNICREKHLPLPGFNYIDLPDRDACREWVIDQQLNRRNLRGWWVAYFRGLKYNSQKKAAHRPNANKLHQNDGVTIGETARRVAQEAGVGEATIERNARFAKSIDQLKSDLGDEFGKKIQNRDFKNLSLIDINNLAEKSIDDKKAIANALNAEPELFLREAENSIRSQEPDPSNTSSNDTTTSNGTTRSSYSTNDSEERHISLTEFKKRQEASRDRCIRSWRSMTLRLYPT
jgi:hypothetical protein